ncbi:uncharacterized protein LOC124912622 [Impatiens glandulifera]|uniref:uncharacterized protein LOC124912622 n=1 Tax=Impatiens glandulifera TaxID=253017 RepID=UPI001FB0FD76|nr:uncharacterized protein LOC124912622 [Impatiens glandulifera]
MNGKHSKMENSAPTVPGKKLLPSKPRIARLPIQPPRKNLTDPPLQRQVFGTTRNPNLPIKPPPEKIRIRKAPIRNVKRNPEEKIKKESSPEEKIKKESSPDSPPRTPVTIVSCSKPNLLSSGTTPYYSGEICNKSWIERMEMASYWVNQIKLAEVSGKDFVSVAFFKLALESKAEPIENLRDELKQYLLRNERLCSEDQWKDVLNMYGLSLEDMMKLKEVKEEEEGKEG